MPTVLGLEGSANKVGAGVVRDGAVLSNRRATYVTPPGHGFAPGPTGRHHRAAVLGLVRDALREAGVEPRELDGVAFTKGDRLRPAPVPDPGRDPGRGPGQLHRPPGPAAADPQRSQPRLQRGAAGQEGPPPDPAALRGQGPRRLLLGAALPPAGRDPEAAAVGGGDPGGSLLLPAGNGLCGAGRGHRAGAGADPGAAPAARGGRNHRLQEMMWAMCHARGAELCPVDDRYCIDNGAMIAQAGCEMLRAGQVTELSQSGITQRYRTDEVEVTWRD